MSFKEDGALKPKLNAWKQKPNRKWSDRAFITHYRVACLNRNGMPTVGSNGNAFIIMSACHLKKKMLMSARFSSHVKGVWILCRNAAWDVDGVTRDCNTIPAPAQPLAREALVLINGYVCKCVYLSEIHLFWCSTVQRSSSNSEKVWSCPFWISCVWVSFKLKQRDLGHILKLVRPRENALYNVISYIFLLQVGSLGGRIFLSSNPIRTHLGLPLGLLLMAPLGEPKGFLRPNSFTCRSHAAHIPLASHWKPLKASVSLEGVPSTLKWGDWESFDLAERRDS